nr:hypothetical protein [Methanophagales archaeon]
MVENGKNSTSLFEPEKSVEIDAELLGAVGQRMRVIASGSERRARLEEARGEESEKCEHSDSNETVCCTEPVILDLYREGWNMPDVLGASRGLGTSRWTEIDLEAFMT